MKGRSFNRAMLKHLSTGLFSLALTVVLVSAAQAGTLLCDGCHGMPPIDSTDGTRNETTGAFKGNHQTHLPAAAKPGDCVKCHNNTSYLSDHAMTNHFRIQMAPAIGYGNKGLSFQQTANPTLQSCATAYCHFNTATANWGGPKFAATSDCDNCHANPPGTAGHGKHAVYYPGLAGCIKCHPDHSSSLSFGHATSAGRRIAFNLSGGTYTGAANSYLPGQTPVYGRCDNTYCHSNGNGGPPVALLNWNQTAPADCTGCHGGAVGSAAVISTNKHGAHVNNAAVIGKNIGCIECHAQNVSSDTLLSNIALHVNNFKEYSGAKAGKNKAACNAAYCHSDGKGAAGLAVNWVTGPNLDCKGCHGSSTAPGSFTSVAGEPNYQNAGANVSRSNSHQKHVTTAGATTCVYCHSSTTTTGTTIDSSSTSHINGGITILAGGSKTFSWGVNKTCSNISCHGAGSPAATWGATFPADCTGCHGGAAGSASVIATGKHPQHVNNALRLGTNFGCTECHAKTVSANTVISNPLLHTNGFSEYSGVRAGGNSSYATATGACSATYCHTDGKGRQNVAFILANGWKSSAALDCKGCHGNDTTAGNFTSVAGEPNYQNAGTNLTRSNSHQKHVGSAGAATCVYCHSTTTTTGTVIASGSTAHILNRQIDVVAGGGRTFTWGANRTCSTISCHGSGSPSVQWGASFPADCTGCHGGAEGSASVISTGKHTAHINNAGVIGTNYTCADCHATSVSGNTTISNSAVHADSFVDYSGVRAGGRATYTSSTGSCSASYCHSDGKGRQNVPFILANGWKSGATLDCKGCHGNDTTSGSFAGVAGEPNYQNAGVGALRANSHQRHVGVLGSTTCISCHSNVTSSGTTISNGNLHIDRTIQVAAGGSAIFTYASRTCSNISCHFNGNAIWGQVLACRDCHTSLSAAHGAHISDLVSANTVSFYNYTANISTGDESTPLTTSGYKFGCANCHPLTLGNHANGSVEVQLSNNAAGSGSLRTKNGSNAQYMANKTCIEVYCHSDGKNTPSNATGNGAAPAWNTTYAAIGGDKCAKCHGNTPTTGAHMAHTVGIHYDDIFNGVSGKLSPGAGGTVSVSHGDPNQATTINCNICHFSTVHLAQNDKSASCSSATCHDAAPRLKGDAKVFNRAFHVNGKTDIALQGIAIISKAQLRPATFSNTTTISNYWNRNGGTNYKSGSTSFDVAKTPLSTSMWNAGSCSNISCHNGKTVQWTDTLDCESCHNRL